MEPRDSRKQGSRRGIVSLLVVAALVAGGGYLAWKRFGVPFGQAVEQAKPAAQGPSAVPVTTAPVEAAAFPVFLSGLGTVQAYNTVLVRSRVDGQINDVGYKEGDIVHQGDVLVQIDPRSFQAALDQALAKKAQDEANLKNAKADLQRYTKLGDFASRQQTDTQAATVAQLTAQVAADSAAISNAQTQLSYATVQAPITGLTGFRQVDVGNIVTASAATGLVTITQIEPIYVVFTAPEENLADIRRALAAGPVPVSAYSTDGRNKLSDGIVALIDNQVDTTSGTIRLKATFENKDHALWPGLSVSTRTLIRTLPDALTVPDDAVQRGPNGLFVYKVDEAGKAQMEKVTLLAAANGRSAVQGSLKPGQKVVWKGQYRVQPGAPVVEGKPAVRQAAEQGG